MGLYSWLVDKATYLQTGIDPVAQQQQSDANDAALQKLIADNPDIYDPAYAATASSDITSSDQQFGTADGGTSAEFTAGWNDAENKLTSGIKNTLSGVAEGTAGFIFKSIPWYFWVIGGIVIFVWFGGLRLIPKPKS